MKQKYAIKNGISEGIVYEESAPYSNSIKAIITLGFFVLALSSFFAFFGHLVGSNKAPEQAQVALLFAAYIYGLIMWGFFSMKFRITNNSVEAVMPPFKYGVTFSEIKEIKIISNIPWYVGWGVRLWGRGLAFVSMRKSAVEIEKRSGFFRRLVLTTQNPEEFVKTIKENLK
ncbi:MAG: hypothetical protein OIN86_16510 [Candidatus Methanoperedens sp.]|nr:hypothetical protein [Candidatus Methanoperedens sp.]CAG1006738.1 hypothetical protein METP1_03374 [Methanosarcinales archaeon]